MERMEYRGETYFLKELTVEDVKEMLGWQGVNLRTVFEEGYTVGVELQPVGVVCDEDGDNLAALVVVKHCSIDSYVDEYGLDALTKPYEAKPELWLILNPYGDGDHPKGLLRLSNLDLDGLASVAAMGRTMFEDVTCGWLARRQVMATPTEARATA